MTNKIVLFQFSRRLLFCTLWDCDSRGG